MDTPLVRRNRALRAGQKKELAQASDRKQSKQDDAVEDIIHDGFSHTFSNRGTNASKFKGRGFGKSKVMHGRELWDD